MIRIGFDDRVKIGMQYVLDALHLCSPYGQERVRRLRFYQPSERDELERELCDTARIADAADALKDVIEQITLVLCSVKDIRPSLRRCREGAVLDHVELFEIKGYLLRLSELLPHIKSLEEIAGVSDLELCDPTPMLAVLDPDGTRSRGFYIPDGATPRLKAIRAEKKQLEALLYRAETDDARSELKNRRTRVCADEEAEERIVRMQMGQALAPHLDALLYSTDTVGRLDLLIQKALCAKRYGGVRPEITEATLDLTDMINPELCDLLAQKGRRFVPVSLALERGATVITGANMGGKSVALKTLALNVLLFQAGFLVHAKRARMPLFHSAGLADATIANWPVDESTADVRMDTVRRWMEYNNTHPKQLFDPQSITGLASDEARYLDEAERYYLQAWRSDDEGSPVYYEKLFIKRMPHAVNPVELEYAWDFIKRFSRNEDGSLTISE